MNDKKKLSEVIDSLTDAISVLNGYLKDENEDFEEEDDIIEIIDAEPEAEEEKEEVDVTEEENKEEVEEGFFDTLRNQFNKKGSDKSSNAGKKVLSADFVMSKAHSWLNSFASKSDIDGTRSKLKTYIEKEFPSNKYEMDSSARAYKLTDGTNYSTPWGVAEAAFKSWKKNQREAFDEDLGSDIDKYQEWVDYDMEHYGKISGRTNAFIKRAGLEVVKDKYGDYEVIARENESLLGLAGAGLAAGAGAGIAGAITNKLLNNNYESDEEDKKEEVNEADAETEEVKECNEAKCEEECEECSEEEVEEGLLDLNPLKAVGGVVSGVGNIIGGLGEEVEDDECEDGNCSERDKALNEAKLSDYEDKFNFTITSKLAEQVFYRDAYILVEPSEIAYEKGCRVIYVDDDQFIYLYNEATDKDLYKHYVDNDIDVDSQLRHIFQAELDLFFDEIGDVRVIKRRYYR